MSVNAEEAMRCCVNELLYGEIKSLFLPVAPAIKTVPLRCVCVAYAYVCTHTRVYGIIFSSLLLFHYVVCVANGITVISRLAAIFCCVQKLGELVKPHKPSRIC